MNMSREQLIRRTLKSRTFWLNLIALILEVSGMIPPSLQGYSLPVVNVANIALRIVTSKAGEVLFEKEVVATTETVTTVTKETAPDGKADPR